jgi:hypothetical protein
MTMIYRCDHGVMGDCPACEVRSTLLDFAEQNRLTPAEAAVLPALFEKAAKAVQMDYSQFCTEATHHNCALGDYLSKVAKRIAKET